MKRWAFIVVLFFAILYASISLVNHYLFRTHALDLGVFNHALYTFSQFRWETNALTLVDRNINYFGDHLSLTTLLYTPFIYVLGSYTCLVIQIVAILLGGIGMYKYASMHSKYSYLPILMLIHFYSIWGIYSALAFDFHENVVAAMFVPWLFYFHDKKNTSAFVVMYLLFILSKENMALWGMFILLGILLKDYRFKESKNVKLISVMAVFSFVYFIVVIKYVMPYLNGMDENLQMVRYAHLGNSIPDIIMNAIKHPIQTFKLFYESNDPAFVGIKSEFYFMLLVSGGIAFLWFPEYLFMLLPVIALKMLCGEMVFWGINYHYSIEFVPILSLAVFALCNSFEKQKWVYIIAVLAVLSSVFFSVNALLHRRSLWYSYVKHQFFSADHYKSDYNVNEVYKAIAKIPENASLSATSRLCPHLAFRDTLYHFPFVRNAEYIALLKKEDSYPLSEEEFQRYIHEFKTGTIYSVFVETEDVLVFKRN